MIKAWVAGGSWSVRKLLRTRQGRCLKTVLPNPLQSQFTLFLLGPCGKEPPPIERRPFWQIQATSIHTNSIYWLYLRSRVLLGKGSSYSKQEGSQIDQQDFWVISSKGIARLIGDGKMAAPFDQAWFHLHFKDISQVFLLTVNHYGLKSLMRPMRDSLTQHQFLRRRPPAGSFGILQLTLAEYLLLCSKHCTLDYG